MYLINNPKWKTNTFIKIIITFSLYQFFGQKPQEHVYVLITIWIMKTFHFTVV